MIQPVLEELNATSLPAVKDGSQLVETSEQTDPRVAMALGNEESAGRDSEVRMTAVADIASTMTGAEGAAMVLMLSEILTEQYTRLTGVPELTYERLTELSGVALETYKELKLGESDPLPDDAPAIFYLFPQFTLSVLYERAEADGTPLQPALREGFERFAAATKAPAAFAKVKSARVIDPHFSASSTGVVLRITVAVELTGTVGDLKELLKEIPLEYNRLAKLHHEAKHGTKPTESQEPAPAASTAHVEG